MRLILLLAVSAVTFAPTAAFAQDTAYCVDRPGANTPPCVLERGQVMGEASLIDWTRETAQGERTDTFLTGDLLLRFGLGGATEGRIGFTTLGVESVRQTPYARAERQTAVGDISIGLRHGFFGTDGPVAVEMFVTLPSGGDPIGDGTWSAGVLLPLEFDLSDRVAVAATPELSAAANESGDGRHLAYGGAAGFSVALSESLSAASEITLLRDDDPQEAQTTILASQSLAWRASERQQFDAQVLAGLNRASADVQVIVGLARMF